MESLRLGECLYVGLGVLTRQNILVLCSLSRDIQPWLPELRNQRGLGNVKCCLTPIAASLSLWFGRLKLSAAAHMAPHNSTSPQHYCLYNFGTRNGCLNSVAEIHLTEKNKQRSFGTRIGCCPTENGEKIVCDWVTGCTIWGNATISVGTVPQSPFSPSHTPANLWIQWVGL